MKPGDRVKLNDVGMEQLPRLSREQMKAALGEMTVTNVEDRGGGFVAVDVDGPLAMFSFSQDDFDVV
jgi:hypothetical protein